MNKTKSILAIITGFFLLTNCATFKSDIVGKYTAPAAKNFKADKSDVLFIFSHYRQTKGWDVIPKLDDKWERIRGFDDFFNDALDEFSNLGKYAAFTEAASDVNDPDRRAKKDSLIKEHDFVIKLKFMREKSFAKHFLGMFVSSITLTLAPVPYYYSYTVHAEIYNSENQLIKNYSRSSHLTKWVQTLMIFAYPFHPEKRKKEELYLEFLHDIFKQIETEKILKKS